MPGQGRVVQRAYTPEERAALGDAIATLGQTTYDIHLNNRAYWCNVPAGVWTYKLGGYQVLKKWLSYRERNVLGRRLKPEEVQYFAETTRRIAGIPLLTHQKKHGPLSFNTLVRGRHPATAIRRTLRSVP